MDTTDRHGDAPIRAGGEQGWAEVVILLLFAAVIGFLFLWALVLHEKPPRDSRADSSTASTADPAVPATLPPPRKYKVTSGGVNVRQGPATNTTVITRFEGGKVVIVECSFEGQDVTSATGSTNLWLKINLGPFGEGYVSALYVDTGSDLEDNAKIAPCL